ncbi:MAG TPA: zinc-binding dehydrogenase [Acidimicrobiales bacterium]|nr:zinc-binding dehydrogenase [Acidimicrobiales bacterium]
MQAVTFVDGAIHHQNWPDPEPGLGEVLVAVRGAGINSGDLLQQRGLYPAPAGSPADIPGLEFAGTVIGCGPGVQRFAVGDRVMGVVGGGAQAERVVIHERAALPIPDGVSFTRAGGFPEAYTTAHDALFTQCGLTMGERVGITGAAGGVGTAAVQLARAAGATVVASVRDASRHEAVAGLGATVIEPDAFWDAGPYDVILELIGGPNLDADVKALGVGGRVVVIGVGAGAKGQVNLLALMAARGSIHASTLRARPLEGKALTARAVEDHVLPLLADGRVDVPVHATYPLREAGDAYEAFAAGAKFGKIVLTSEA